MARLPEVRRCAEVRPRAHTRSGLVGYSRAATLDAARRHTRPVSPVPVTGLIAAGFCARMRLGTRLCADSSSRFFIATVGAIACRRPTIRRQVTITAAAAIRSSRPTIRRQVTITAAAAIRSWRPTVS